MRQSVASNNEVLKHQKLTSAIKTVLLQQLGIRVESDEADLTGVLDSLALIHLVVHLESALGVRVPMENLGLLDVDSFLSVATIAELVVEASASNHSVGYQGSRFAGIEPLTVGASSEDPSEL